MLLAPGAVGHLSPRDPLNEWMSLASVIVSGLLLVCGILLLRAAARNGRRGETVLLAVGTAIAGVPVFLAALLVALELITGGWSWGYPSKMRAEIRSYAISRHRGPGRGAPSRGAL